MGASRGLYGKSVRQKRDFASEALMRRLEADANRSPRELAERDARFAMDWIMRFAATAPGRYRREVGGELFFCGVKAMGREILVGMKEVCGAEKLILILAQGDSLWMRIEGEERIESCDGDFAEAARSILKERANLREMKAA